MPDTSLNLLTEPLIRVRRRGREETACTLPHVLTELDTDDLQSFTGLRIHQEHAWHAFLVQLAAIALNSTEGVELAHDADWWEARLRQLTGGADDAWCLVTKDLTQPAFLQPPVPENSLDRFSVASTPDGIDVLVTSRNHNVKAARILRAGPDHWIYAVVTLQTMAGYAGRGNYGIARMNSGYGSRPCAAYSPGLGCGERFRRDVRALLAARGEFSGDYPYPDKGGGTLLWLEPWDGAQSIGLAQLDPFFIEVCRRVRLTRAGDIVCHVAPSRVARVAGREAKGDTGDAWTPVDRAKGSALTVSGAGYAYRLLHRLLLSNDFARGSACKVLPNDPDEILFWGEVLARGEGLTDGFHRRLLRVPKSVRLLLGDNEKRDELARVAERRVTLVDDVQRQVLRPALCALIQGGPEKLDFRDERTRVWLSRLDKDVDAVFFESLWEDASLDNAEADRKWARTVLDFAWDRLRDAARAVPLSGVRSYRARATAERLFRRLRRKYFPNLAEEGAAI